MWSGLKTVTAFAGCPARSGCSCRGSARSRLNCTARWRAGSRLSRSNAKAGAGCRCCRATTCQPIQCRSPAARLGSMSASRVWPPPVTVSTSTIRAGAGQRRTSWLRRSSGWAEQSAGRRAATSVGRLSLRVIARSRTSVRTFTTNRPRATSYGPGWPFTLKQREKKPAASSRRRSHPRSLGGPAAHRAVTALVMSRSASTSRRNSWALRIHPRIPVASFQDAREV